MSIIRDILASYRMPKQVVAQRLAMGVREDRAVVTLMAGCGMIFVAQWPRLARDAHFSGEELNPILGGQLLAWVFIMPLVFYVLAIVVQALLRVAGQRVTGYNSRFALFWAILAIAPLSLLRGLVGGFLGTEAYQVYDIMGLCVVIAFSLIWIAGLRAAITQP